MADPNPAFPTSYSLLINFWVRSLMNHATTILSGGTVFDPSQAFPRRADVRLENGVVAAVGDDVGEGDAVDCRGKYVCPGFVDLHAHLREPGDEEAETIASGGRAAVAGGFTGVCCLPGTTPPLDTEGQIEFVIRQAQRAGLCRVWPIGALTKNLAGEELAEIGSMHARGAVAFGDGDACRMSAAVMKKALQYAGMVGGLVVQLAEEPTLGGGVMHAGRLSARLGLPGTPPEVETLVLARDLQLLASIGGRYHARALTTAAGVDLLRRAKSDLGPCVRLSCDATPAHLLLTDAACGDFDALAKLRPPLRTDDDRQALICGLADGTIDAVATHHAPQRPEAKDAEFAAAADGSVMLEHALPLAVRALVEPGHVDWMRLVELLSTRPAQILNLPGGRGTLAPGAAADVVVVDPHARWRLDDRSLRGKSRNTPFLGWDVTARVEQTYVAGRRVHARPADATP